MDLHLFCESWNLHIYMSIIHFLSSVTWIQTSTLVIPWETHGETHGYPGHSVGNPWQSGHRTSVVPAHLEHRM